MRRFIIAIALIALASPALARPHWRGGWHPHYRGPSWGSVIIGTGLGYIIGRSQSDDAPPPAAPPPEEGSIVIKPWTPQWYDYCAAKYQSFDAKTGYYEGYDGQRHFCR